MITNLPDLDDLLKGINDIDLPIGESLESAIETTRKDEVEKAPVEKQTEETVQTVQTDPVEAQPKVAAQETPQETAQEKSTPTVATSLPSDMEQQWNEFLRILQASRKTQGKKRFFICKLDSDLAYSLDECSLNRHSRADFVNAIIRTFINAYLPRLAALRKERKSLLDAVNTQEL